MIRMPRELLERLKAAFSDAEAARAAVLPPTPDWTRIPVVEDPSLPPGIMLIGASGLGPRVWDNQLHDLRFSAPLWPPAPAPFHLPDLRSRDDGMGRDVYERERAIALEHLERQLDGLCDHFGIDPEAAWRAPRREETRQLFWARQEVAYRAEERFAFTVRRPDDFAVVRITGV